MDIDAARKALKECELRHKALARRIADIGFIWQGSVSERYLKCGKATCACQKDPDSRHGPYYYWTTKVAGKSVAKKLDGPHAELLQGVGEEPHRDGFDHRRDERGLQGGLGSRPHHSGGRTNRFKKTSRIITREMLF